MPVAQLGVEPSMTARTAWDLLERSSSLIERHFELGTFFDDFFEHTRLLPHRSSLQYVKEKTDSPNRGVAKITNDRDKFEVVLDVREFQPDNLSVKTVDDYILIQGTFESHEDGYVCREFSRRYMLPKDTKAENVVSTLSTDGMLVVKVPKETSTPVYVPIHIRSSSTISDSFSNDTSLDTSDY